MLTHPPRAIPWEIEPPVGNHHVKGKHRPKAKSAPAVRRCCLGKGCRRRDQPRCWNQRDCQEPKCQREVLRWQAAKRQAKRCRDADARAQNTEAAASPPASQVRVPGRSKARSCACAWSRSKTFFPPFLCDRPGCHEPPVISLRNPARYCCPACRQAVRNVLDRERKWRSRGTLDGRKKRTCQYQAARRRRSPRQCTASPRHRRDPLRSDNSSSVRRSSIIAWLLGADLTWAS